CGRASAPRLPLDCNSALRSLAFPPANACASAGHPYLWQRTEDGRSAPREWRSIQTMAKKQKAANPYYQGPASDHFDGRCFFNPGGKAPASYSALLKWQLGKPRPKWPARWPSPFPAARPAPRIDGGGLRITMVGHASL